MVYIIIDDNTVDVTNYEIYSENLPKEFNNYKIAVLSDFHNSSYYEQIAKKVKAEKPDLIVFTGDITNMVPNSNQNSYNLIESLKGTAPMYAILGNHDVDNSSRKIFEKEYENKGLKILRNSAVLLEKEGQYIQLYGTMDSGVSDRDLKNDKYYTDILLPYAKGSINKNVYSIMLNHRANTFDDVKNFGYDLILSGHLHGGLVRLPFLGGVFSSGGSLFPEYTSGLYSHGKTKMVVSRGLDKTILKPRIFNGPEIVTVLLKSGIS